MMHKRVIWLRRCLMRRAFQCEVEFSIRYVRHLRESVPAVYRAVDTPPEMHKTTAINTQTKERK